MEMEDVEMKAYYAAKRLYGDFRGDTEMMLKYWDMVRKQIEMYHQKATEGDIYNKRKIEMDEENMKNKRAKLARLNQRNSVVKRRIPYLPDELLLMVFSYLSVPDLLSVSQVCNRWNALGQDTSLWKELDFEKYSINNTTTIAKILQQPRFRKLNTLKIYHVYDSTFYLTFFPDICCLCGPSLTTLEIVGCDSLVNMDPLALNAIASSCSSLTSIDFSGNSLLPAKGIKAICKTNRKLKTIKLNDCENVYSVLPAIAEHCRSLERLEIRNADFSDYNTDFFAHLSINIKALDLVGCAISFEILQKLSKYHLTELSITIPSENTSSFLRVLNQMKRLQSLYLDSDSDSDEETEGRLGKLTNLRKLKELRVPHHPFTKKELQELAFTCPNLTSIDFSMAGGIDNKGLQRFVKMLPNLVKIDISGCEISGLGVEAFAACTNLKELNLYYCPDITDKSIEIIARKCQKLESFCLGGIDSSISHVAIHHLTRFCTNLTELDLSQVIGESYVNETVRYISERCSLLQKLYLSELRLYDNHISKISQGNSSLQLLDISLCELLTDRSLLSIARLPELQMLCLYMNNFTDPGLMALSSRRPYLKVVQSCDRVTLESRGVL